MCVKSVKECQRRHSNKKSVNTLWRLTDSTALIKIDILSSEQVTNLLKATDNRPTKGTEVKQVIKLCPNFTPRSFYTSLFECHLCLQSKICCTTKGKQTLFKWNCDCARPFNSPNIFECIHINIFSYVH